MSDPNPVHAAAAVEAMDTVEKLMDRWFKGQSTPVDVLMQIAKVVGEYQMSKP
ncbi:hypothetical protein IRJ34_07200 [Paenarthrobacter sp. GOM3]|uniref:hypothetical protein n=1 Tax=Paenarthrobacter sp. GOM3 TaxID=2782567 RepID=UPI001BA93E30|nr:hypothetical protein [Paenarthrobacter sp. GOM3]WOH20102.1 hypothetical protein IRJ34_07200 [Paenarthrobacter sp. GOM3]